MTHIATKTVLYHVKPGVVFALVEGKEVDATGFNLEQLKSSGLVKKANLLDKVKDKLFPESEEAEVEEKVEEVEAESEEAEVEAPKKRGRPKKPAVAE